MKPDFRGSLQLAGFVVAVTLCCCVNLYIMRVSVVVKWGFRARLSEESDRYRTQRVRLWRQPDPVFTIFDKEINRPRKCITLSINGSSVPLQIDTTSDISIILQVTWKIIRGPQPRSRCRVGRNASGHPILFLHELLNNFSSRNFYYTDTYYFARSNDLNLSGIDWIEWSCL